MATNSGIGLITLAKHAVRSSMRIKLISNATIAAVVARHVRTTKARQYLLGFSKMVLETPLFSLKSRQTPLARHAL